MRFHLLPLGIVTIILSALAHDCSRITSQCGSDTAARSYCSNYLSATAVKIRHTVTVSTVYTEADAYTTITIDQCPTAAPTTTAKHTAVTTPAPRRLSKRQGPVPSCRTKYGDSPSNLSSACSCFDNPSTISTLTKRRARTITLRDAPTTTVTSTHTLTSARVTPSCVVTDQPPSGPPQLWKRHYGYCNTFQISSANNGFYYSVQAMTICDALNQCAAFANHTAKASTLFEISYEESDGSPSWSCVAYPSYQDLEFDTYGVGDPSISFGYVLARNGR